MRATCIHWAGLPTPRATPKTRGSLTAGGEQDVVEEEDVEVEEEDVEVEEVVEEEEARERAAMSSITWQQVHSSRAVPSTKKAVPTSLGVPPSQRAPTATTARCQEGTAERAR